MIWGDKMEMSYKIVEWFSVFAEGFIVFAVSGSMCGKRYKNGKHISMLIAFSCLYTILITLGGKATESILPVLLLAAGCSFAVNLLLARGSVLLRCASLTTTWFFLHALDYVLAYGIMFVTEKLGIVGGGYTAMTVAGQLLVIIIFCLMWKIYPFFRVPGRKYLGLILAISSVAYAVMFAFAGMITGDSLAGLQTVSFFSILFIAVSLIVTVFAVTVKTGYEKEKREAELMAVTNSMLEKNFLELENSHNTIRQQVHDFKNHLFTIRGMLENDKNASSYIDELLEVTYEQAQYSRCGNNVIDSIINCKAAEAKRLGINFSHRVMLSSELYLSSIDICAVLANQLDNAIEACMKLTDETEKNIKAEIWQKESFVFFKVTNTCPENPFTDNSKLVSTKKDPSGLHGYGIKNITKTAESYGGTMKSHYADGEFVSVAMIPNNKH